MTDQDQRIKKIERHVKALTLALEGAGNLFRALPKDVYGTNANGFIRDEVIEAIEKVIAITA